MQRIFIVEDDIVQLTSLYESIHKAYPSWEIITGDSFEAADCLLSESIEKKEYFSMFLLDIQLKEEKGDMSGFVLAEHIRSYKAYFKTPVLFLTSISEKTQFALATYHCYNYITKPYESQDILYQIEQMMLTGFLEDNCLTVTDTNRITHRVLTQDIQFIEFKSHQVIFTTDNGILVAREMPLEKVLRQLTGDFIQCHKKYVINLNDVQSYAKTNRYIGINQAIIPVSRTFKSQLEAELYARNII